MVEVVVLGLGVTIHFMKLEQSNLCLAIVGAATSVTAQPHLSETQRFKTSATETETET